MGDSYASGVGTGEQPADDTNRCFRFPNAYPAIMQAGAGPLQPSPLKWNNVACSVNTTSQILAKEFLDQPEDDGKNGIRPVWGDKPEFVTLTMCGNDIGILNLITTCIFSFKLWGKNCEEVIQEGELHRGNAQFFNQITTQCNNVSIKPSWNPLSPQYLTVERRTAMNTLALALNTTIQSAVDAIDPLYNVYYVGPDSQFRGHRFCDQDEPSPNNPSTWFFN
ncbi:hypothetical protein ABVK25_011141 [Lepraria finkii]|uniref:SGNH hydrolase-type esterase domain-containing protein n=1 Tax=Lepraria finkii TaxID=1340010 RepID=A0ABR4ARU1_9LECA